MAIVGPFRAIGTLRSTQGTSIQLKMIDGIFDRGAKIKNATTGETVARIHRQFLDGGEIIFGKQTYIVEIQPGNDMAVIVAMCICLDEMRNEKKR